MLDEQAKYGGDNRIGGIGNSAGADRRSIVMTDQTYPHKPIRNRQGEIVYTSFQQRPQPTFQLDAIHKALLVVSIALAGGLPVLFGLQTLGSTELLPMRYGVGGEVLREGSVWEATLALTLLGLATIAVAVLARYPRIFNYPVMLTEDNAQRQYKNAAQMMAWIAFSMAMVMLVMAASWMGLISIAWLWAAVGLMMAAAIVFIWRMIKLR